MDRQLFEVLSLLQPSDIDVAKIRIGRPNDGGYVLADLPGRSDVVSFGISGDVEFERQMAERGHRLIHMFDHTIEGLPERHERFRFQRLGICAAGEHAPNLLTLTEHLEMCAPGQSNLTLKIDVEGFELGVFANMRADVLDCFDQVIVEVHNLHVLTQRGFAAQVRVALLNLTSNFTLFHVHGNNFEPLQIVNGLTVAPVMELSFVRTTLVRPRASTTLYPTNLDARNNPVVPDLPLLFFPFLPMNVSTSDIAAALVT